MVWYILRKPLPCVRCQSVASLSSETSWFHSTCSWLCWFFLEGQTLQWGMAPYIAERDKGWERRVLSSNSLWIESHRAYLSLTYWAKALESRSDSSCLHTTSDPRSVHCTPAHGYNLSFSFSLTALLEILLLRGFT